MIIFHYTKSICILYVLRLFLSKLIFIFFLTFIFYLFTFTLWHTFLCLCDFVHQFTKSVLQLIILHTQKTLHHSYLIIYGQKTCIHGQNQHTFVLIVIMITDESMLKARVAITPFFRYSLFSWFLVFGRFYHWFKSQSATIQK